MSPNKTWGRGSKKAKKSVTYYLNGPLTHRQGRLQPRVTDFKGPQKCFESLKNISQRKAFLSKKRTPNFFCFAKFRILVFESGI